MNVADQTTESSHVQKIAEQSIRLGVRPGGVLMVHSSLSALGHVPGGAETVIRGLLQALGDAGTLLMPALTFMSVDSIHPIFDIRRTPSDVGAISECFRTRPGTRRSLHPTHSVCGLGPLADELLGEHLADDTPCGPHSPFHLLPKYDGQILMLGCGLLPNTSMHAVEQLIEPPYLYGSPLTYCLVLEDGSELQQTYRQHGFQGWIQCYDRIGALMHEPGLRKGRILKAPSHLLNAQSFWQVALNALCQDPLSFVDSE